MQYACALKPLYAGTLMFVLGACQASNYSEDSSGKGMTLTESAKIEKHDSTLNFINKISWQNFDKVQIERQVRDNGKYRNETYKIGDHWVIYYEVGVGRNGFNLAVKEKSKSEEFVSEMAQSVGQDIDRFEHVTHRPNSLVATIGHMENGCTVYAATAQTRDSVSPRNSHIQDTWIKGSHCDLFDAPVAQVLKDLDRLSEYRPPRASNSPAGDPANDGDGANEQGFYSSSSFD